MIPRPQQFFLRWRYYLVIAIFLLGVLGLIWRIVYLTVIDRAFLQQQGNARVLRTLNIPAYRGIIADRKGEPLAISTPVDSLWVDPHDFKPDLNQLNALANQLNLSPAVLAMRLKQASNREFLYLMRGVDPATVANIKALAIPGVYMQSEFRRYYPEGEVTAHVLGITNIDDQGREGLELAYNQWLQGVSGKRRVLRDRLGHIAAQLGIVKDPRPGHNLVLSLDRRIQYLAYRELQAAVEKFKAQSGSIVVLEVNTGEVLAMVNHPSYNPNQRPLISSSEKLRNRAMTDVFEPGSVIKTFSVAAAIESQKYKANSIIDTRPGWMNVDGNIVRDPEGNLGILTLAEVLKHSSNVGIAKVVLSLPPEQLLSLFHRVGFGQETGTGFPGERTGVLVNRTRWRPFDLATLAFGYGISVTPLQLAQAYSIFAAGGVKYPVSLLHRNQAIKGERVLDPKVAQAVMQMLEKVVERGGSGVQAQVPRYRVAGKTGTARLLGPKGYLEDRHIASFVGIAPASRPRLVVVVVIGDPREKAYYASTVAAPVFSKVMAGALTILNIPPDNISS